MVTRGRASPPGIDLVLLARHTTWPRWVAAAVLTVVAFALAVSEAGARELALVSPVPLVLWASWPVSVAVMTALRERLFVDPRWRVLREIVLFHAPATLAAAGACSAREVSPAYALLLVVPPCWGHLFVANRTMALSLAVSPLLLRLLTVRGATPASLAVAAALGVLVAGAFLLFSWRRVRRRRREARQLAAATRGAHEIAQAADRWAASRLHDRLSGVLMLAEARGERADARLARAVIEHARSALEEGKRGPTDARGSAQALRELAASLDLPLEVDVAGACEPSSAWHELHEMLGELVANQARHAPGDRMRVRLSMRGGAVHARVEASSRDPRHGASGRGRRNLEVRAAALDGRLRWRSLGEGWSVSIGVPALDASQPLDVLLWMLELLAHGAALMLLAQASMLVALVFGGFVALLAVLTIADMRSDRRLHQAALVALRAQIEHALPDAIGHARSSLDPLVQRLERAVEDTPDARRDAISALSRRVSDLLARLESSEPPASAPS